LKTIQGLEIWNAELRATSLLFDQIVPMDEESRLDGGGDTKPAQSPKRKESL
jgi:hypothetical protein